MKPYEHPARFLFRHALRRHWSFAGLLVLVAAATLCAVGVQYTMKLIVDTMTLGNESHSGRIWGWLAVFIGLIALESALWRISGWLGCRTIVATGVEVRLDLFDYLSKHSTAFFSRHLSGALGNRVSVTAGAAGSIYGTLAWRIIPPIVDFAGAVVVTLTIDPRMAATLVGFVASVAILVTFFGVRGRVLHRQFAAQGSQVSGEVVDTLNNIWNIKAFSARRHEYARLNHAFLKEAATHRLSWLYLEKTRVLHDICLVVMTTIMLGWAIHNWTRGRITPGEVVVLSALTFRLLHGSRDLALALVECTQQFGVVHEMLGVIAVNHEVEDPQNAPVLENRGGEVRFDTVRFQYSAEASSRVFDGLDLYIPAGQRIGIVGPSGAGKSTLVALLQRLAEPQAGSICIDGQSIHQVQQDSLRAAIAVVPQEVSLLRRSLLENIRYGRADATDEEVFTAARHARCESFVARLPLGYDTIIGEQGALLSGGERQRIGIARAFLMNAQVVVLDEATSALDSVSEAEIQVALSRLWQGRTVIAVAHRLGTVAGFDRVVVLAQGRIVEDGSPARLLAHDGLFASMWKMQGNQVQAEEFIEG